MKIAISGASGFIGSYIDRHFTDSGHTIIRLNRELFGENKVEILKNAISGCNVVINLAGASINHRWSKVYKKEMYSSRIETTRKIVEAINSLDQKPRLLISASAVGYYPSKGCFDEYNAELGHSFLAGLCDAWEKESQKVDQSVRLVNTRFGIVLSPDGGALKKIMLPAKMGFATIIGNGSQLFPWIDIEDLARSMEFIITHEELQGAVNLVAPQQISNREFMRNIAKCNYCLLTLRVPEALLSLTMGESAQFITEGQCVKPTKITDAGFVFKSKTIEIFLKSNL